MTPNLIEDESENGYTIRSDLMEDGQSLECRDDKDMHVQKDGDGVILTKKCFVSKCFSK